MFPHYDAINLIACARPFRLAFAIFNIFEPYISLGHFFVQVQSENDFCLRLVPPVLAPLHILMRLGVLSPNLETTALTHYLAQVAFLSFRKRSVCVPRDLDGLILNVIYGALHSVGAAHLHFSSPANLPVSDSF